MALVSVMTMDVLIADNDAAASLCPERIADDSIVSSHNVLGIAAPALLF